MSFDSFWKAYPIKQNKKKCRERWEKRELDKIYPEIMASLEAMLTKDKLWKIGIGIPHPYTYINGDRWEDEPDIEQPIEQKAKLPRDSRQWEAFCIERGIKPPTPYELEWQAKQRIEQELGRAH